MSSIDTRPIIGYKYTKIDGVLIKGDPIYLGDKLPERIPNPPSNVIDFGCKRIEASIMKGEVR